MRSPHTLICLLLVGALLYFSSVIGQKSSSVKKWVAEADSLQQEKKYSEAAEKWKNAWKAAENESDSTKNWLRFKYLYASGVSHNYEVSGIPYLEEAYPLLAYSRLDSSAQSSFLNTYYHFLGYNNRWEEALPFAYQCMKLRENLEEDPPLAYLSTVHDMAFIHNKIRNYPEAIGYYLQSIDGYTRHKGMLDNDVALGYNNLAFNYGLTGMANKQFDAYSQAAKIWSSIELADKSYLMTAYRNLLKWQKEYGNLRDMEGLLARIRELIDHKSRDWGSQNQTIAHKNEESDAYLLLNYWNSCLDYHQMKKDIPGVQRYLDSTHLFIDRIEKPTDRMLEYLANAYSVLGEVYEEGGDHDQAVRLFHREFSEMKRHGYGGPMPHTHAKLAKSLIAAYRIDEAAHHLREAFAKSRNSADMPLFHILSASLAEKRQQPDSVRYHVAQTLTTLAGNTEYTTDFTRFSTGSFAGRANRNYIASLSAGGHHMLKLYRTTQLPGDLNNAGHLFTLALEMLNGYYLGGPYTDVLADLQTAIQYGLLECQTLQPSPPPASLALLFENLENNRSRHRWKKFIKNMPSGTTPIPDSLQEAEEQQRQLLLFYKQELSRISDDSLQGPKTNTLKVKIHDSEARLAETEEQLLAANPRYMMLSQGRVSTRHLQKELPRGVSMLRYILTDSGAYVMQIGRSKLRLIPLGSTTTIDSLVRKATEEIRMRSPGYYVTASRLHSLLLGKDITEGLHCQLIIVPDGILHQLPFEALTPTGNPADFLIHTHTVSYSGSASLWLAQRTFQQKKNRSFAAFAPQYAGSPGEERLENPLRLTGASHEAGVIAGMLNGRVYQRHDFGKSDFLKEATGYSLLHIAMHADVKEEDSESSNFHFGDGSRLYAYELYNMRLQANMAVLSACNTGYGSLQKGEGIQSLAMAFTYAGVPSLVMGLWSLPDASTSEIMIEYYRQLLGSKYKNAALATAKTSYLQGFEDASELQHPFYWAGLVVSGDVKPIYPAAVRWYWAVAVAAVLAMLAFVVVQRSVHRKPPLVS